MTRFNRSECRGTAIVLGVDTPIGVAVIRNLGRNGISVVGIGRSGRAIGFASRYCSVKAVRPREESEIIEQIVQLARKYTAGYLLAISENDLLMINRHREVLNASLTVLTPAQNQLKTVLNKDACQQLAEQVGIRVPHTVQPQPDANLTQLAETLNYPVVIKWSNPATVTPRLAANGLGFVKADYAINSRALLEKLGPYSNVGVLPMLQEYCPGKGLGQMFLVDQGEVLLEFQHERVHEWPPEGGVSSLCQSVSLSRHMAAREKSRLMLQRLNWTGVAMVEYRFDASTGNYWFMEINGRFWGSLPLAIASGRPFAAGLIWAHEKKWPKGAQNPPYAKLSCCYAIPEIKHIIRLLFQRSRIRSFAFRANGVAALTRLAWHFLTPKGRFYLFMFSDPGPFFSDLGTIVKKALGSRSIRSVPRRLGIKH